MKRACFALEKSLPRFLSSQYVPHHENYRYLASVKRRVHILFFLAALFTGVTMCGASANESLQHELSIRTARNGEPQSKREENSRTSHELTQAKRLLLLSRGDVSSAILPSNGIVFIHILVCTLDDPLVNQFTRFGFIRFRPRDPPSA